MYADSIERVIFESRQAWHGYDASADEIRLRIWKANQLIDRALITGLKEFDLTPGEFGVLIELRLAGAPFKLTPTQLYNRLLVTGGAMTGRVDKLEKRGLARRTPDPNDRRSVFVELTESGLGLIEGAAQSQHRVEEQLTAGLTPKERERLAALLRKLVLDIDQNAGPKETEKQPFIDPQSM